MTEVEKALAEYRAALEAKQSAVMQELAEKWMYIENNLRAEMSSLSYIIQEKISSGVVIDEQYLWKMQQYQRLLIQAEDQIDKYQGLAESIIESAQRETYVLGVKASEEVLSSQFRSIGALNPFWERVDVRAVESISSLLQEGKPLSTLLNNSYPEAVEGLKNVLLEGIARGFSASQIASNMANGFGMGLDRSLLIAQTEMARAYRTGMTDQFKKSGVVEYYVRFANKFTACGACLALDGQKMEIDEELSDHPRGCCNVIPKVKGVPLPDWKHGEDWLKEQSVDYQKGILGPTRWEAWSSGQYSLLDMTKITENSTWGGSPGLKTLDELGLEKLIPKSSVVQDLQGLFQQAEDVNYNPFSNKFGALQGMHDWTDSLDEKTMDAIRQYTGADAYNVNRALRDGTFDSLDEEIKTMSDLLDSAFDSAPATDFDFLVRRSVNGSPDEDWIMDLFKEGNVVMDKGFISTTAGHKTLGWYKMEIAVPKGSNGVMFLGNHSIHPGEMEVLLDRNARFKVLEVVDDKTIRLIYLGSG